MPTYVYRCKRCGRIIEMERPFTESNAPPPKCECGSETARVFTPPLIQFIGPGFHVNDYKK